MTVNQPTWWIAAVDEGGGRLMQVSETPRDRLHLDVVATFENEALEHERGRPSPRTGKQGNTYASAGHESEALRRRYAKRLSEWLEQQAREHRIRRVGLFAPPRLLGELRQVRSPQLASLIEEREADLRPLGTGELATHPAVVSLVHGRE